MHLVADRVGKPPFIPMPELGRLSPKADMQPVTDQIGDKPLKTTKQPATNLTMEGLIQPIPRFNRPLQTTETQKERPDQSTPFRTSTSAYGTRLSWNRRVRVWALCNHRGEGPEPDRD